MIQENYSTPPGHTPGNPPFANYEGNPGLKPVGKGCSGYVPVRCVETTLEMIPELKDMDKIDVVQNCQGNG